MLLINLICFGPFIALSAMEMAKGATTHVADDREMLTVVGIEIVCGTVAALILRARGWTWSDFGFQATFPQAMGGMLLFIGANILIATFYTLFTAASGIDLSKVTEWSSKVSIPVIVLVIFVNPLYEELFEVAYNVRAGESQGAAFVVTLSALIRFACHLYQGPIAAVTILPLGIIFALVYWKWRRLWPLVVAHLVSDVFGLWPQAQV